MYYNQTYFFTKFAQKISIEISLINRQTMCYYEINLLKCLVYLKELYILYCVTYSANAEVIQ